MSRASYASQVFIILLFFGNLVHNEPPIPRLIVFVCPSKSHTLPYFLTSLRRQEYDKKSMDIIFYVDENNQGSMDILSTWVTMYGHLYNTVTIQNNATREIFPSRRERPDKSAKIKINYKEDIEAREFILTLTRRTHDFLFMCDSDVFLTEPDTFKVLSARKYPIVAPMLVSDESYSNFWLSSSSELNETEMKTYMRIFTRERKFLGCCEVRHISSAIMINLNVPAIKKLTYDPNKLINYKGPKTNVAAFEESARRAGIKFRICNDLFYGYVVTPADTVDDSEKKLTDVKLEAIYRGLSIPVQFELRRFVVFPKRSRMSFDKIYMINLDRRGERRMTMMTNFLELGMEVTRVRAVDGSALNQSMVKVLNLKMMKNYEDPYHKRPMKTGELGCFLSHYEVWNRVVRNQFDLTLVLEDDVHFMPGFREKVERILDELKNIEYDFIYLGRKILMEAEEEKVTAHTTRPLYSYWTIGYIITYNGAAKLLNGNPLMNILPVDEYIPIMFDSHPNSTWKSYFPNRNLIALSANPLLLYPTHYVGMPGYVSDTESSYILDVRNMIINPNLKKPAN